MGKLSCGVSIPGVFERDGRYYKVVRNKWLPLSRIDEGVQALYRALYQLDPARPGTFAELIDVYRAAGMDELKPSTQKRYRLYLPRLSAVFGRVPLGELKGGDIAVFLEKRRKKGRGAISANRERAALSSVCNFGMRQGWLDSNPCLGVRRNKERPRKRYVTNEEFLEAFHVAPEPFQDLLAAAYLTGARQGDVLSWTRCVALKPHGIVFVEGKTGKGHTVEWSDALRFFVRRSMARFPEAEHVFTNKFGQPWTTWAVSSQMRRLSLTWTFKDLRAKAQTDAKHSVLGHGAVMESLYRKHLITRPVR